MKLSNAAAYAVHAMARLANNAKVSPVTSKKLAEQSGLPERFLLAVLQDLSRCGILHAARGPNGGFRLIQ
jgi:Rrf2 family protein